jgi:antirestriction protein ArdC
MGIDKSLCDDYPSIIINGTKYHFGRELTDSQYLVENAEYAKDYWCFDHKEDLLAFLVNLPDSANRNRVKELFPDWHEVSPEQRSAYIQENRARLRNLMQQKIEVGTAPRFPVYPDDGSGPYRGQEPFRIKTVSQELPLKRVESAIREYKETHRPSNQQDSFQPERERAKKDGTREDLYTRVTNHILKAIEEGPGGYRAPWHVSSVDSLQPRNVASEQPYRGVNVLCLWATAQMKGYPSGVWGTYKQWQEQGAQVRGGEKSTTVVFWKESDAPASEQESEESERKKRFLLRGYSAFNLSQVDGFTPREAPKLSETERIELAHTFFFKLGADIRHGGDRAFYSPRTDYVQMPPYETFRSADGYYNVLAHELTHWSGAEHRLARDLKGRFHEARYAAEELVAELGAAFSLAKLGISAEPRPDHAAYIASWISLLKNDSRAIFTAASKAQQAVDWLSQEHERLVAKDLQPQHLETFEQEISR